MFPWVYGFTWNAGNIVFLGIFFTVVSIIVVTLALSFLRTVRSVGASDLAHIRWESEFHDLPVPARTCRHVFAGDVRQRVCSHAFECGTCTAHSRFEELRRFGRIPARPLAMPEGFSVPSDRLYHRGHTWVRKEAEGSVVVGLDDLALRVLGDTKELHVPPPSTRVHRNAPVMTVRKGPAKARILCPVEGEIVENRGAGSDWLLRIRPASTAAPSLAHLLTPGEAALWMESEFERLQQILAGGEVGVTMADGGTPVQDLSALVPEKQWDHMLGELFLDP